MLQRMNGKSRFSQEIRSYTVTAYMGTPSTEHTERAPEPPNAPTNQSQNAARPASSKSLSAISGGRSEAPHSLGSPRHSNPVSSAQRSLQPSRLTVLPSSHASKGSSITPSPQRPGTTSTQSRQ